MATINRKVLDISHHNTVQSWPSVKNAGIVGVIHKATEGTSYRDPQYLNRCGPAMRAGLLWGAYHFGNSSNVKAQVDNFIGAVGVDAETLYALDWEDDPNGNTMTVDQAKQFLALMDAQVGPNRTIVYSGNTVKDALGSRVDSTLGKYRLWLAQYSSTPKPQASWSDYFLWQYSDGNSGPSPHGCPGVSGEVDTNSYQGSDDELRSAWVSAAPVPPVPPPPDPNIRPTLSKGDTGPSVTYLQQQLNIENNAGLATDGDFGPATYDAVCAYQASRHLSVDGICGPQTWEALDTHAPPYTPPGLPPPMTADQITEVTRIAEASSIYRRNWKDRGVAPPGYTKGVAVAFANTYRQFLLDYPPALEMSLANSHNSDKDVLSWEAGRFATAGMPINEDGAETLCSLWAYILGLGMRESSGRYCTGRDQSASNTSSNTCEAGAWQTSYDAHNCSVNWNVLFDTYLAGGGSNPQGFVEVFREGASCGAADWECYGSGDGYQHQKMSKEQPAYAAQVCAITLRKLRQHYGPVNRREVEIVPAAFDMLMQVRDYIDETGVVVA